MSTSYKSLFPAPAPTPVEAFRYAETSDADGVPIAISEESDSGDEMGQLLLRAHAEGVREGEERERARGAGQIGQERARITESILRFQTELAEYYARTEMEVVQLALGIASKILHREAQVDSLLLAKLTRAVLDKLHQNTKVKVRVSPEQAEAWRAELAPHSDGKIEVEVIEDETVEPQNCVLETEMGATEIGLAAQLAEIESGLFDLLAQAPER